MLNEIKIHWNTFMKLTLLNNDTSRIYSEDGIRSIEEKFGIQYVQCNSELFNGRYSSVASCKVINAKLFCLTLLSTLSTRSTEGVYA